MPPREPISPRTARLMYRAAIVLGTVAGVLFLAAFAAGLLREGIARWVVLFLGLIFVTSPLILRRVMPPP